MTATAERRPARPDPKDPVTSSTTSATDPTGTTSATTGSPPPSPPPRDGAGAARRLGPVLWALALVLLVVAGLLVWKVAWPAHRLEQERAADAAALAAGRAMAVNYSTLDYRQFDAYQQRILDGSTGSFHDQWGKESSQLKSLVTDNKSTSTPTRTEAALVTADADSAEVLVGVVAGTTNTAAPDGVTKTYRMDLKLSKVSGRWKVSDLAYVS